MGPLAQQDLVLTNHVLTYDVAAPGNMFLVVSNIICVDVSSLMLLFSVKLIFL